ncbi:MAG: hypothetical protein HRU20_29190 [Pseudomonadales bacterium]|nr:hypothetical protein [Pseudomonadales bacterium]
MFYILFFNSVALSKAALVVLADPDLKQYFTAKTNICIDTDTLLKQPSFEVKIPDQEKIKIVRSLSNTDGDRKLLLDLWPANKDGKDFLKSLRLNQEWVWD